MTAIVDAAATRAYSLQDACPNLRPENNKTWDPCMYYLTTGLSLQKNSKSLEGARDPMKLDL